MRQFNGCNNRARHNDLADRAGRETGVPGRVEHQMGATRLSDRHAGRTSDRLRSPTNASLIYLACDNNSGTDGRDSALNVPVVAGQTNIVLVDGVNGASGILQLNYNLLSSISLRALGTSFDGGNLMQVLSRTNANFSLLRSTNMIHWSPILTTNSPSGVYNHADPKPPASIRYFYRAQLLP